jgi:GT2 family glycosyltransferase
MKDVFFTVSIVTMNRVNELKRALESVYQQTYKNYEIIVLDNNSSDNTVEMIETNFPDVRLIKSDKNLGCPPARNVMAKEAKGNVIFFLDDDAWLENNVLEEIAKAFGKANKNVVLFATNLIEYKNFLPIVIFKKSNFPVEIFDFSGGYVAIKLDAFKEIGYFPEFHYGAEESFVAIRFFLKGYKMYRLPYIFSHHKPSFSRNNDVIFYNKIKNELTWNYHFAPLILFPLLFLRKTYTYTKLAKTKGSTKSSIKGMIDFIKEMPRLKRAPISLSLFLSYLQKRKYIRKKFYKNI